MNRRDFLKGAGIVAVPLVPGGKTWADLLPALKDGAAGLTHAQWETLAAVQDHLFPSESHSPGAREANATAYLYYALTEKGADPANAAFIAEGVGLLEKLTLESAGKRFTQLDESGRENILRQLEKNSTGKGWLVDILNFLMEAMLADPVYGGNPDEIGWRWLAHTPGFPRSPSSKVWNKL